MASSEWRCSHIVAPAKAVLRRAGWRRSRNPPSCRTMRRITLRSNPPYKSASFSTSPRSAPEGMQDLPPGGRGECRVPSAPAASCAHGVASMHTSIHSGRTGNHPASPHAMVLTVSFALSPVIGLSCHRHCRTNGRSAPGWADLPSDNLTPASRRQDHTTSPSATGFVVRVPSDRSRIVRPALHHVPRPTLPRPPHPAPRP